MGADKVQISIYIVLVQQELPVILSPSDGVHHGYPPGGQSQVFQETVEFLQLSDILLGNHGGNLEMLQEIGFPKHIQGVDGFGKAAFDAPEGFVGFFQTIQADGDGL